MKLYTIVVLVVQLLAVILVVTGAHDKCHHCGRHATYNKCGIPLGCVRTCETKDIRYKCAAVCTAACYCNEDYIREYKNGPCIHESKCPI